MGGEETETDSVQSWVGAAESWAWESILAWTEGKRGTEGKVVVGDCGDGGKWEGASDFESCSNRVVAVNASCA